MAQAILRESFSTSNFGKWNAAVKAAHPSPKWTTQMPRRPLAVAAIWCSMSATWTTTRPGLSGAMAKESGRGPGEWTKESSKESGAKESG